MLIDVPTPLVMGMLGRELSRYFIMFDDTGKIPMNLVVMGSSDAVNQTVQISYFPMEGIEIWARYFKEDVIGKGIHNIPKDTIMKLMSGDTEAFTTGELVDFCNLFVNKVYDFMANVEPTTSVVPLQAFLNPDQLVVRSKPGTRFGGAADNVNQTAMEHMASLMKEEAEREVAAERGDGSGGEPAGESVPYTGDAPILFPEQEMPEG